jgi:hypothetical protein
MLKLTLHQSNVPVHIVLDKIIAFHPGTAEGHKGVKLLLEGGTEILVNESMGTLNSRLPAPFSLRG